jgi:glycine cleavage system H protein
VLYVLPLSVLVMLFLFVREYRRERYGTGPVDGTTLADAYRYAPSHAWLGGRRQGGVKVGLDDLGRRILGDVRGIALQRAGTHVAQGDTIATITTKAGREVAIPAPVAGVITDANERVAANPGTFEEAPYTGGWLVAVRPDTKRWRELPTGNAARDWFRSEDARFARFLEAQFGLAAADGGHFLVPPQELLPQEKWNELVDGFLKA